MSSDGRVKEGSAESKACVVLACPAATAAEEVVEGANGAEK